MHIQILSDLHLEMGRQGYGPDYQYDIPVRAEYLALLGDIGSTLDDRLFEWLKTQLKLFKVVYFVLGNHESYRSSLTESTKRIKEFAEEVNADPTYGTFIPLSRTRHDVSPTTTILGCTLWSAINPAHLDMLTRCLMDFRRIAGLNPETYAALHQSDLAWLNSTIASIARDEPEREVIVFTHHAPTIRGTAEPKYEGGATNSAFSTELTGETCWTSGKVKLWAFGHTHWSCDFERNGVRVYSNPRGYGNEGSENYDSGKVVEL